jgi:RNA polymerase sigma-70 factor (ECF subfamily)
MRKECVQVTSVLDEAGHTPAPLRKRNVAPNDLPKEPSDEELLSQFRAGDRSAFERLVLRHHGLVYAVAYARLQNVEAAEDLAQEVCLRAFLQQGTLRDGTRFAPWIANMARHLSIDWLRRGESRSRLLPLIPMEDSRMNELPSDHRSASERLQQDQERSLANEAIARLPAAQRELVLLHFSEGLSKSEIARQLGVNPSTVGRQLDSALEAIRGNVEQSLRKRGAALRSRALAPAKTVASIAALAALTPEAQAALAAQAGITAAGSAAASSFSSATILETLKAPFTYLIGGTTAMGTGQLLTAGAVAVTLAASTFFAATHLHSPSTAAPPTQAVAGTAEIAFGKEQTLAMEHGKVYSLRINSPTMGDSTVTWRLDSDYKLYASQHPNAPMTLQDDLSAALKAPQVFIQLSPYVEDIGSFMVEGDTTGAKIHMWLEHRTEHAPRVRELAAKYLDGKINAKAYRQGYAAELRRFGIEPKDPVHQKLFRDMILTSIPIPSAPLPAPPSTSKP